MTSEMGGFQLLSSSEAAAMADSVDLGWRLLSGLLQRDQRDHHENHPTVQR